MLNVERITIALCHHRHLPVTVILTSMARWGSRHLYVHQACVPGLGSGVTNKEIPINFVYAQSNENDWRLLLTLKLLHHVGHILAKCPGSLHPFLVIGYLPLLPAESYIPIG
jgi:hypothetical protein